MAFGMYGASRFLRVVAFASSVAGRAFSQTSPAAPAPPEPPAPEPPAAAAPAAPAPNSPAADAPPPGAQAPEPAPVPVIPGPPAAPEPAPPPAAAPAAPPPPVSPSQSTLPLEPEPPQDGGVARAPARPKGRGDFSLELDVGLNVRLGEASSFQEEESVGGAYAAAFWLNLVEEAALGLELQHSQLGRGEDQRGPNLVNVEFSATTAWLSGRFVPLRSGSFEGFVALRAGLALQHVDADGVRQRGAPLEPAVGFTCNELDGPSIAFGGGLGARFGVGPGFSLVTRIDGNAHRLSSERIGDCAAGVGSSTSVGAGIGLAYEFGGSAAGARAARSEPHTW
jgi:hypothetical protein